MDDFNFRISYTGIKGKLQLEESALIAVAMHIFLIKLRLINARDNLVILKHKQS